MHLYSTFLVFQPLKDIYTTYQHSPVHTLIHTPITKASGAIWGSVSCPRTLQYAAWMSLGTGCHSSD